MLDGTLSGQIASSMAPSININGQNTGGQTMNGQASIVGQQSSDLQFGQSSSWKPSASTEATCQASHTAVLDNTFSTASTAQITQPATISVM